MMSCPKTRENEMSKVATCSFCGEDTSFLAHSPHLCLRCGDAAMQYSPEQVLDTMKRFAEVVAKFRELYKVAARGVE
jgi:hypothetical protein